MATLSRPTIAAQTGSLIEDTSLFSAFIQLGASSSGSLGFDDSALNSSGWLRIGITNSYTQAGLYGLATLDTLTGKVSYALDNTLLATNKLAGGSTVKETFTVPDVIGGVKYQSAVSFSIKGTNDAAVITGTSTATLTETNSIQTTTGILSVSDVDSAEKFVAQTNVNGSAGYGKFSINTSGVWTYTVTTAHDEFKAGTTYRDSITVKAADGTAQIVTVSIVGTDDAMVFGGVSTASLIETNAVLKASGTLTAVDADTPVSILAQANVAGDHGYGVFSIAANGKWTYTAATAHNEFQAGTNYTDSFTVITSDGSSKVVTVNIAGTNDAAVITGTTTGTVNEAGGINNANAGLPVVMGLVSDTDVDGTANKFIEVATAKASLYGSFTMTSAGVWTYNLDNNNATVQALGVGKTLSDKFTVNAEDGTAKSITVTIKGADDAAVITGPNTAALTETNLAQTTTGQLKSTDVDSATASAFVAQNNVEGDHGYGKFTVDTTGKWTYAMNTAHDEFQVGQSYSDSFTVKTADGASKLVTVTILGTNDAAIIIGPKEIHLTETNDVLSTSGQLIAIDPDGPEHPFIAQSTKGDFGTFTINADGQWVYTTNSAHNEFAVGSVYTDPFVVRTVDGVTEHIVINIDGTNDAPIIRLEGGDNFYFDDHTVSTFDVRQMDRLSITDPEGDALTYSFAGQPAPGFTLNPDGTGTIDTRTYNYLAEGEVLNIPAAFIARDVHGAEASKGVNAVIIGTNDAAIITGNSIGNVTEDSSTVASGTLTIVDTDTGESIYASPTTASLTGSYGAFTFSATTGAWTYTVDSTKSAVQALGAGSTATDTLTVYSYDGTASKTITATLTGVNDVAVISGTYTGTATEDSTTTASGTLSVTDVDTGEAVVIAQTNVSGDNGYGTFSVSSAGAWTYTLDSTSSGVQALAAGSTTTDTLTVASADGTDTQQITVTITGVNDAAVISGTSSYSLTETDAVLTTSGILTSTDVDGTTNAFTAETVVGTYGSLAMDAHGAWKYTTSSAHDEFVKDQVYTDAVTVHAADGTEKVITINITGANSRGVLEFNQGG